MKIDVIYQHRDFIIIYKLSGLSVHKDNEAIGLTAHLAKQLGLAKLWLVHRLDKVTSGLLMLATNSQSAAELSQLFANRQVDKTYLALTRHKPKKKQGRIVGDMQKARDGAWKLCQSHENPAKTRFISIGCEPHLRLFVLHPETGKTHQLRVAMKSLGSPILGDLLYGKKEEIADRVYLHATRLEFVYQKQRIQVCALPREGEYWHRQAVKEKIQEMGFVTQAESIAQEE